jgi:hypothetical protein
VQAKVEIREQRDAQAATSDTAHHMLGENCFQQRLPYKAPRRRRWPGSAGRSAKGPSSTLPTMGKTPMVVPKAAGRERQEEGNNGIIRDPRWRQEKL